ncbi:MAG: hypothetical protein A3J38_00715 [Gammaproteobacteria bacterium RIFCSPHIGHO2_12_FULL_45_9]|nr:MAG: hypothetical protein A3J38_00715 [Gammaproteobacteria bacterium RIFCSPHIGHO2_12_FULL_45_9]
MQPQKTDVEKKLIEITTQLLSESGETTKGVSMDASLQRHLGIDSLARAELFQRVEKMYGIPFPDRLMAEAETLADIAQYLQQTHPDESVIASSTLFAGRGNPVNKKEQHPSHVDPSKAESLTDLLLLYAKQDPERKHIFFQNEEGGEEILTYGNLLQQALIVAHALQQQGLRQGETVAIMLPTQLGFFYAFFGILFAGGIPVPIYPPFRAHALEAYAKQEARILHSAEVRILITFQQAENLSRLLSAFVPSLKLVTTLDDLMKNSQPAHIINAKLHDKAFIQYTSGSTNTPKGVLLTHYNLLSNIRAYGKAGRISSDDIVVSWLPLYHDMGLIGAWLGSLYFGVPLILMTPFSFLNRPERWLWAIHYHRATISAGPNFAYELCINKIDPTTIEGLDLSSWRIAANGAEAVYPKTLERFIDKFAPYGFKPESLYPVYGLAESTVGLAIPPLGRRPWIDYIDRLTFEAEKRAIPATAAEDKHVRAFPSCGKPIPGHEVRIVNDENHVLAERHVGQLQFRGPSSMQGYYNNPEATAAIFHNGWIDSGDLAYLAEGEIFITGRKKDVIIKAGRNLYPAEIEELVASVPGIRQGCVVAFGTLDIERATEQLVIVAETRNKKKEQKEQLRASIHELTATTLDIVPDHIVLVAPHTISKTSSGKLQRAACKEAYLKGKLSTQPSPIVQIAKLGTKWLGLKTVQILSYTAKLVYTGYVALMLSMTLFIVWLIINFTTRDTAGKLCRLWAKLVCALAFCPVKVIGKQHLQLTHPVIYAANHASYVDVIFLMQALPHNIRFVGKKELLTAPIIRTFMKKLGYLAVDRVDLPKGLEDTKQIENTLKQGAAIAIFPEGTFGYGVGLRPFKLGAFKLSAETNTPLYPVALQGTRWVLRDKDRLLKPGRVTVTISEPIHPQGAEWQEITRLKNTVRAEIAKHCGEPTLDLITPASFTAKKEE